MAITLEEVIALVARLGATARESKIEIARLQKLLKEAEISGSNA